MPDNTNQNQQPVPATTWLQTLLDMPARASEAGLDTFVTEQILASLQRSPHSSSPDPNTLHGVLNYLFEGVAAGVSQLSQSHPFVRQWFNNYRIAEAMENAGHKYSESSDHPQESELFHSTLNHQFLTEDAQGKFQTLDKNAIVNLFKDQSPDARYPHIILTASHAHARNESDLSRVTRGIATMANHCFKGETLAEAHAGDTAVPGQTMIVMACEARENFLLEGAALYRRIRELKDVEESGKSDEYREISPAARRIAKLILAAVVETPEAIDIDDVRQLRTIASDGNLKLRLKPNAIRIAQSFMLSGYSKGGNVVSDAARYLADELVALDPNQQPVIDTRPAMRNADHETADANPLSYEDHEANVRSIMRKIGLVSKAALEVEMSVHYKNLGVRRLGVLSIHDRVAYDNLFHANYDSSPGDELLVINGTSVGYGHQPDEAMGDHEKTGYISKDQEVDRRLKEWYAPLFGKAALANIRKAEDGSCIILETVPNTSDSLFETHKQTMVGAMENAGLQNVIIERNGEAGRFRLTADGLPDDHGALDNLANALRSLRNNAKGLVIAEVSYGEDLDVVKTGGAASGNASKPWVEKTSKPAVTSENWPFATRQDGRRQFQK